MRILILEDDPFIALDLQMIAESEGHDARVCGTIADASKHLDAVDIALLDVNLPDGDSYDLAQVLIESGVTPVFVSGSRRSELPAALRQARFIAKPFSETAIIEALRSTAVAAPRPPQPRASSRYPSNGLHGQLAAQ